LDFNRFDVSTKELIWDDPVAWLQRSGIEPHGLVEVKDSTTYQKILRDGRAEGLAEGRTKGHIEEARRIVLRRGTKRFGEPEAAVLAELEDIGDINRLEDLIERSFDADVRDWDGLLGLA
jgi:hypothetical protein